jgi:hypothetical protein
LVTAVFGCINARSETCSFGRVEGRRDFSTIPLDRTVPLRDLWAVIVAGLAEVEAELDVEDEMGGMVIAGLGYRCDEGGRWLTLIDLLWVDDGLIYGVVVDEKGQGRRRAG